MESIVIHIFIFFIFALIGILSRNYQREWIETLDKKKHTFLKLYPGTLFFLDGWYRLIYKLKGTDHRTEKESLRTKNFRTDNLRAIYIGENLEEVTKLYQCKRLAIVMVVFLVFNGFSMINYLKDVEIGNLLEGKYIKRPEYSESAKDVELQIALQEGENVILQDTIEIKIDEKAYTTEEIFELFQKAMEYVDTMILGENLSEEQIESNLNFVTKVPDMEIKITWNTSDHNIIDKEGRVYNEELIETALIGITTQFTYQGVEEEYIRYFKVLPKQYTVVEKLRKDMELKINQSLEDQAVEEYVTLPEQLGEYQILWKEEITTSAGSILVLGMVVSILIYFAYDYELQEKIKKRNQELLLDYSEFISKFSLLLGAGMSVLNAWEKIVEEYKSSSYGKQGFTKRYLYEEMVITHGELKVGISEVIAYERFGRRIKLIPYLRFSSLLAQNVKKGSANLLNQLEMETVEAFSERKELVRRLGEEAGTKLLIPMMLLLVMVLIIIIVPAFLSFQL